MKSIQFLHIPALLLLLLQFSAHSRPLNEHKAYYTKEFYSQVESGIDAKKIRDQLFKVLDSAHRKGTVSDELVKSCAGESDCYSHTPLTYGQAREFVLGYLDLIEDKNGYALKDVYCQEIFTAKDFSQNNGPHPGRVPDHNVFNVEHTWPQSRFSGKFSKGMQKPDLHILYGASSRANSSRGNIEFADVQTEQSPVCPSVRRGWVRGDGGRVYFEPPDEHKGNVARSIFYFSVRYQLKVSEVEEASLRRWHQIDPVDATERERHEEIFKAQKNRNPFIDHPELVDMILDF